MAPQRLVKRTFSEITRIDIINGPERVRFATGRKDVDIDGAFRHQGRGLSEDRGRLFLIGFDGQVSVPDDVVVNYRYGVGDIWREVFRTYAPSLPYGELLGTRAKVAALEPYRDVPNDVVLHTLEKFWESNGTVFFTSQDHLYSPPALELVERRIRTEAFAWDGQYTFLSRIQAGDVYLIPEIARARTVDELVRYTAHFVAQRLAVTEEAATALLEKLSELTLVDDPAILHRFVHQMQDDLAITEAQARALGTTVRTMFEERLDEALDRMRADRIPYGATLVAHFGSAEYPLSNELWGSVMAKAGAMEAALRPDDRPKGEPSSTEQATQAHAAQRECADWRAKLKNRQAFCMCLTASAAVMLRDAYGGGGDVQSHAASKVTTWANQVGTQDRAMFGEAAKRMTKYRVDFEPSEDGNTYKIRHTGEECDSSTQSLPSEPPTTSTTSVPESPESTDDSWSIWDYVPSIPMPSWPF